MRTLRALSPYASPIAVVLLVASSPRPVLAAGPSAAQAAATGEPAEKSGVSAQAISVPQGSGTVQGMGESFTAQLSTGTASLRVPVSVPAARGGLQPSLAFAYASSGGQGVAGVGFTIGAPFVSRQTDRGLPRYEDPPAGGGWTPAQDRFVTSEGQELVPVCLVSSSLGCSGALPDEAMPSWAPGWQYFRVAIESAFTRYFWSPEHRTWRAQSHGGQTYEYGVPLDGSDDDDALERDPLAPSHVSRWNLARAYDAHGDVSPGPGAPVHPRNVARYRYAAGAGTSLLVDVYDTPPAAGGDMAPLAAWAHHVHLAYEDRPDPTTSYRRGYATIDASRVVRVDVTSKTFGGASSARELLRRYHATYDPAFHASQLTSLQMEGRCTAPVAEDPGGLLPVATGCPRLPAMTFAYTHVTAARPGDLAGYEAFDETPHAMGGSPRVNVDGQRADFFDVNADGLPDVLVTDPSTYGAKLGLYMAGARGDADAFTADTAAVGGVLNGTSASLVLGNPTVVPVDIDGDGVVDLLHMPRAQTYAVYTPVVRAGGWVFQGRAVTTASAQSPLIDLQASARTTRTLDVDGDGLLDVVVSNGGAYQTFFGLGRYAGGDGQFGTARWRSASTATIATSTPAVTCTPWSSTPVALGDADQKIADMNGDGLPDIVRVRASDVRYWPGRGNGMWGTGRSDDCPKGTVAAGRDVAMGASPALAFAAAGATRLRDVNGDGLDDLIQLREGAVDVWLNVDGRSFTPRAHTIATATIAPSPQANARMRFADVNGSGTVDMVWGEGWSYRYVDLAGGARPRVLTRIANGLGKTTDLAYASSTALMLEARRAGAPWERVAPMPLHVLTQVTERDHLAMPGRGPGEHVVRYQYRDAVYDGRQREFRGFRSVRAIEQGDPGSPTSITESTFLLGECEADAVDDPALPSPCTPQGAWRANPREALKGLPRVTSKRDEQGRVLSTDHTTYRLRRLYAGLDGRDVRHAFAERTTRLLYDTASFAPAPADVPVVDVDVEVGGATVPVAGVVTAAAAYARVETTTEMDPFGSATAATDLGCVEGCAAADEAIVTTHVTSRPAGDASGWLWRAVETWTGGSQHPDRAHHTRVHYDARGDADRTEAELVGSLPLDRRHEVAGRAVAPPPPAASRDGWILVSLAAHDPFGNVTATRGSRGRCHDVTFDEAYAQLAVTETVRVGAAGPDGCGTTALAAAGAYDRGLGAPTLSVDVHGEMTAVTYDGLGRVLEVRRPDPARAGQVDAYPSTRYEYHLPVDAAATPWSAVRVVTHDATSVDTAGETEAWRFTDGMGRAIGELRQADPAAGDGAAWVADEVTEYDRGGRARFAWRAWFYGGDPLAFPASALPASARARARETRYDAFGRAVEQIGLDGASMGRTAYHALSSDAYSAEDVLAGSDPVPATTVRDGHGRTREVTERVHVAGGIEARATRASYTPSAELEVLARATGGAAAVVRWMTYDSLGRRVLNVEPDTSTGATATPGASPDAVRAFRYAYDDEGTLVGTSDARGCGANYHHDAGGRLVGEDYSPCLAGHAAYTPVVGGAGGGSAAGLEVAYLWDAALPGAPAELATPFVQGRLMAITDRASQSVSSYDGRGRLVASARRLATPDGGGYAPRWYVQSTSFDARDRPLRASTGAASAELLGDDGTSEVETRYAASGQVASVAGSYGVLVRGVTRDAKGLVQQVTLGDAASTGSAFAYDARDRLAHAEARRLAPAAWQASASSPADRSASLQLLVEATDLTYDVLDRPTRIQDGRDPAEWPAGAKPVDRAMKYDDLGRVLRVDYAYAGGPDPWVSPTAAEEAGASRGPAPMPRVAFDRRVGFQTFAYDALGNVVASADDAGGFFDRSLGAARHGTAADGPYQLRSASAPGAAGGDLDVDYDAAGDMTALRVRRAGGCLPQGAICNHRFAYDWDEVGRLVRARRWDEAASERDAGALDMIPAPPPSADLRYAYDASDARVLKSATDAAGATRHTAYLFASLELRQTTFEDGDYVRSATTEVARLFAHGVPLAEVRYLPEEVPTASSGRRHVLLRLADHLGSTGAILDKDTGELVEETTYLPYGATESDHRPARWGAFRSAYGFTGKEEDVEVGLTYFGKRFLAPALLRWASPDPLAIHGLGADLNVYAYVHGSVFAATDPTGLADAPVNDGGASGGATTASAAPGGTTPEGTTATAPEAGAAKGPSALAQECPQCASFLDGLQIDASKLREGLDINGKELRKELNLPAERWSSPKNFPGYHVGKSSAQEETKHVIAIELARDNKRDFNAVFFSLNKGGSVVGVHFGSIGTQAFIDKAHTRPLTAGGVVSGDYSFSVGSHRVGKYGEGNFMVLVLNHGDKVPMMGPNNLNPALSGQNFAAGVHVHSALDGARASQGCLNIHNDQYADFLSHFGSRTTGVLTVVRYDDIRSYFPAR